MFRAISAWAAPVLTEAATGFGINLFAAAQVAGCSIDKMMKPLLVSISVILCCLMLITYVPVIAMFLPDTFLP